MDVDFTEEMPDGSITFKGTLTKDETSFLLKFSLMSLLARGMAPASIMVSGTTADTPDKETLN